MDDGRCVAALPSIHTTMGDLNSKLLLKVSAPILPGMSFEHLGRIKRRTKTGWITQPAEKLANQILEAVGLDQREEGHKVGPQV